MNFLLFLLKLPKHVQFSDDFRVERLINLEKIPKRFEKWKQKNRKFIRSIMKNSSNKIQQIWNCDFKFIQSI